MKPSAYKVFAVLLLATFSITVGCSHNTPPELSNLQRELNEKEKEIKQLASENSKKEKAISTLSKESSKKDNQLKDYQAKLDQQVKYASMQDQSSPEASLYPPQANPGECFARVFVPPTYATSSERVLNRSASERLEIIPAQYEWVEEKVMVKAASERIEVIPAKYEWVEEQVLVKAVSSRLEQIPAKY